MGVVVILICKFVLGYKPFKVTHSSDYFDQLYEWAVQLIKADLAYVCHQGADEMKGFNQVLSPWRDRPISENLQLFEVLLTSVFQESRETPIFFPTGHEERENRRRHRDLEDENYARRRQNRSRRLSDKICASSSDRRQMVHLSDVRLYPLPLRQHRKYYALVMHQGIPIKVSSVNSRHSQGVNDQ